ncbi:hypothetical protein AB1Y20_003521 [Prymnesium parvum]|uniref:Alpha-galactosidase n=1 Tax=Prymnesium parvum TaxID=97485 RepID=A0AB34J6I5_PRYPA
MLSVVGSDLLNLTVCLDGAPLFPPGPLSFLEADSWKSGADLLPLSPAISSDGSDALGAFTRLSRTYQLGASELELSVRAYSARLVFEQRFPQGLRSAPLPPPPLTAGLRPLASWPSFALAGARAYAWRSWHGSYGSFSSVGLTDDSIVFNGGPAMPLLFFPNATAALPPSLLVSPLDHFKDHAHASADGAWLHGPSYRYRELPPGYSQSTLLVAARGQTATVSAWGEAVRSYHRTTRQTAADLTVARLGYWTDNGAYYNFNKWAGNLVPGREWSPRLSPAASPAALLGATLASLRAAGVPVAYVQLDDWWYGGVVYEGAVACARDWEGRRDWFPRGVGGFSREAGVPLLLYLPYLCNDTALLPPPALAPEEEAKTRAGGVADTPPAEGCAWPQNLTCRGVYALPRPHEAEAFYARLFARGKALGMAAFEHDFVGQDSLDFGWTSQLGAAEEWLQGLGRAAAAARVPVQFSLPTASDLLESLRMPWVTTARASADYALCADSWDMGFSALLHWAVGVRPFKDVMWTTPRQPGSPYENTSLFPQQYARCLAADGTHRQKDVALDALVSAFSTGPVGLGDADGRTDARLASATCDAAGRLLSAAKPLTPLDSTWRGGARRLGAYTALGGDVWQHVVAVDAPCAPLRLEQLHWPRRLRRARRYAAAVRTARLEACAGGAAYGRGACVRRGEAFGALCAAGPHANGSHAWALATLAPLLGAGWALLGEVDKFVAVSAERFDAVDARDPRALRLRLRGAPGEAVRLLVVTPPPNATALRVTLELPRRGAADCRVELDGRAACE